MYELPERVKNTIREECVVDYGKYRYILRGDWMDSWVERYLVADCESNDARLLNPPSAVYY